MKKLALSILTLALTVLPTVSLGATYPEGPVKLVVGYAAGGFADAIGRKLAEGLTKELGQPVVVSNVGGSAGGTAAMGIKNEKADGYTLGFVTSSTFSFNPLTGAKFGIDDFTFVAGVSRQQEAFVSLPNQPWKDMKSMLEWAKKEKKTLTCASHMPPLTSMLLNKLAKQYDITIKTLPTKGGAEVVTNLLGGHVDFGFMSGIQVDYVKNGQMTCLAATGKTRQVALPEIPTLQEEGLNVYTDALNVVFAPANLPDDVRARLEAAISKVVASPAYKELIGDKMGLEVLFMNGAQVQALVTEIQKDYSAIYQK